MQLRHRQTVLCLYFFLQVICCYQKNDYIKSNQRINTKKYYSTNAISTGKILNPYSFSASTNSNLKIRHSPKFPKFDELKNRIANLDSDSSVTSDLYNSKNRYGDSHLFSDGRSRNSLVTPRFRHQAHGWSNRLRTTTTTTTTPSPDDDLFKDEKLEDEDSSYEDDFFYATDDDDDDDEDIEDDFQAEEPTERPNPTPKIYPSMSEFKWDQYGNRKGVEEARRMQLNIRKSSEENRARAAVEHYIRVKNTGSCRKPIPKVIPVQQEHPNPAVTYTPHCTVLHRCAEDTGCCRHDGATCQYKEKVEIPLYFYVKELGSDQAKVEKLIFYNHTECECKDKSTENVTERQKRIVTPNSASDSSSITMKSSLGFKSGDQETFERNIPENLQIKCRCPREFIAKIKYSTKCYCDCAETNEDCLRMKKGKEYYSLTDRLCILNNQCGTVQCEYGSYMKQLGRCPRKDE